MKSAMFIAGLLLVGIILGAITSIQKRMGNESQAESGPTFAFKVGSVNIGPLLDAHWKQILESDDLDPKFRIFQEKARKLQQKLDANKQRYSAEMENLKGEYAGSLENWHDQRRKEIEDVVKVIAERRGFHLVYCNSFDVEHWINPKTNLAQFSCHEWSSIFGHQAIDLTKDVMATLKERRPQKNTS